MGSTIYTEAVLHPGGGGVRGGRVPSNIFGGSLLHDILNYVAKNEVQFRSFFKEKF